MTNRDDMYGQGLEDDEYGKTVVGDNPWEVHQEPAPAPAPAPAKPSPQGGFVIPGYEMRKLLGRGGMGEVFLADRVNAAGVHVPCAVKTLLRQIGRKDIDFAQMLLDEARLCTHLRHPNIVSIMDVGYAQDRLYVAMEWIDGIDAMRLVRLSRQLNRQLPFKHVLYITRESLKGLHYAHTATGPDGSPLNVVHRDIAPDNLLISRQGAVKLADFGVALGKTAENEAAQKTSAGKPAYKAPELWKGQPATVQSDIFAMGATFYELMTGRQLFEATENPFQLMLKVVEFDVEKLLDEDLTLPDGIEHIMTSSLAQEPGDRYESALEFLEDVNDFCFENGVRLLDAHFSRYIDKMLTLRDQPGA